MPRITDARRDARRTQIAQAALRCFQRDGLERTSMSAVSAEAGLSVGSIYVHYENKTELVKAVAAEIQGKRLEELAALVERDRPPSPGELLVLMTEGVTRDEARVALQLWGGATTDPVLYGLFFDAAQRVTGLLGECCAAWLVKVQGRPAAEAEREAADLAVRLTASYQGYFVRKALIDENAGPAALL